jgi:hypothetical protein
MMTMNFFNGLVKVLKSNSERDDSGLRSWARLEYKGDAEYAYNYYKSTGQIPALGVCS